MFILRDDVAIQLMAKSLARFFKSFLGNCGSSRLLVLQHDPLKALKVYEEALLSKHDIFGTEHFRKEFFEITAALGTAILDEVPQLLILRWNQVGSHSFCKNIKFPVVE